MHVYPVTFVAGTSTVAHGELVTDVTLPLNQDWTIIPAPNGNEYWGYPAGNPPIPTWATIPDFVNQNVSFSINIATLYLTPAVGCTIALNGSLPAGFAFDIVTNLFTYDGSTVSGPLTVSFTATLTGPGTTSTSNAVIVSG